MKKVNKKVIINIGIFLMILLLAIIIVENRSTGIINVGSISVALKENGNEIQDRNYFETIK